MDTAVDRISRADTESAAAVTERIAVVSARVKVRVHRTRCVVVTCDAAQWRNATQRTNCNATRMVWTNLKIAHEPGVCRYALA